nr:MAG TPA: Receptor activity-modifying protein 2, Calcitonin, GPCR, Adrenomedullin, TRAFFICKING, CLR.6A [Caudoviricetes sp.]
MCNRCTLSCRAEDYIVILHRIYFSASTKTASR